MGDNAEERLQELIRRRNSLGPVGAIDFLIEIETRKRNGSSKPYPVTYTPFSCKPASVDKDLERFKKAPGHFPKDIVLPDIVGLGNDYSHLELEASSGRHGKGVAVSIVVLTYNRASPLARTLAGLVKQDYPLDLMEIVVADDGSSDETAHVIRKYSGLLDIKYVWHKDVGFTAAAARNNGIRVARNDFVILLDADMFPSARLVKNYVRWSSVVDRAVLVGPRKYVDINEVDPDAILEDRVRERDFPEVVTNNDVAGKLQGNKSVDWRMEVFEKTDNLKKEKVPFRVFASGNVAFSKMKFEGIGGFDERFRSWGCEDTELGFRFFNAGCYVVPVLDALAYHQEPKDGKNETDRVNGKEVSNKLFGDLCPHYRKLTSKKNGFEVPTVSIYMPAHNAEKTICDAIDSALNQSYKDLEVCVCDDGSTDSTPALLERYFSKHPRVRWVRQKNGGIGAASNTAVRMTKGVYIGQLDSDDYLATDVVEKCVAEMEKRLSVGLVYTTYENEHPDGRIEPGYNYPVFTREKLLTAMIVHHFRMFRKAYWYRTSGFHERIKNAVDYDMYLKLAETCEVVHLNIVGYRRRLHGENTSIKAFDVQVKNAGLVVSESLARIGSGYLAITEDPTKPALTFVKK